MKGESSYLIAEKSREEPKFVVAMWALENMRSQRQSKIIFAGELGNLFGAVV